MHVLLVALLRITWLVVFMMMCASIYVGNERLFSFKYPTLFLGLVAIIVGTTAICFRGFKARIVAGLCGILWACINLWWVWDFLLDAIKHEMASPNDPKYALEAFGYEFSGMNMILICAGRIVILGFGSAVLIWLEVVKERQRIDRARQIGGEL